jgi:hypothetical protein
MPFFSVYGDDELKHLINFKGTASQELCAGENYKISSVTNKSDLHELHTFKGTVSQDPGEGKDCATLNADLHDPHTVSKLVNKIIYPPNDSKRDVFIENSIKELKKKEKKTAKETKVRDILNSNQLYVKTCVEYVSQGSKKYCNESIVCL